MNTTVAFPGSDQSKITFDVCVDVSKSSLSWHHNRVAASRGGAGILPYTNAAVIAWLEQLQQTARSGGLGAVRIICESTSGYHQRLLRLSRAVGCRTALVSGEQVKQMQVVENNDTGKSDHKGYDPTGSVRYRLASRQTLPRRASGVPILSSAAIHRYAAAIARRTWAASSIFQRAHFGAN